MYAVSECFYCPRRFWRYRRFDQTLLLSACLCLRSSVQVTHVSDGLEYVYTTLRFCVTLKSFTSALKGETGKHIIEALAKKFKVKTVWLDAFLQTAPSYRTAAELQRLERRYNGAWFYFVLVKGIRPVDFCVSSIGKGDIQ